MSEKNGIILYRKGLNYQYCDVLGQVIPFLIKYEQVKCDGKAILIAKKNLDYFIKSGVDKETYLPAHGFNIKNNDFKILKGTKIIYYSRR